MLTPDFEFQDARGKLLQLVHSGYTQVNIIMTNQGVIRGGHYHKKSREAFYIISGSVDVTVKNRNENETEHFSEGTFFEIDQFTIHTMSFPESCIMVALYDVPIEMENGEKDIWPA